MGKKKKIKKSIESLEKRKKEHEEKIENYIGSGGKDYSLIEYWEGEVGRFEKEKEKQEKKLHRKKSVKKSKKSKNITL